MFFYAAGFTRPFIFVLMSRFHSYINTAVKLIALYKGEQPFAVFIKLYFSKEKKYGSRDRKKITALCYNYFRLGAGMKTSDVKQKIIAATFLCEQEESVFLETINPEWNRQISLSAAGKLKLLKEDFIITDIFPFRDVLSNTISTEDYCQAMLLQPFLFLRIRPQCRLTTLKKLEKSKLLYQLINTSCARLPPSTNAEDFFIVDKEVVVQDYNSQQVFNYLQLNETELFGDKLHQPVLTVWDCCAASGGKSILLNDVIKRKIDLTISDIRLSIVLNLHQRFKKANIKEYKYMVADVGNTSFTPPATNYNLIVCDAPCTGSGTWGRTPEQLCFFNLSLIKEFSEKQKRIVKNVVPHLVNGGIFVYITCSVFKEENEMITAFIQASFNLQLLYTELLKGFTRRADTMFVAVFKK
jgi:16S rRNA (cytosine967-C5)-methyltransferase